MAITNGWGQAAVNNTIGFGQGGKNSATGWGETYVDSWGGDTDVAGVSADFSYPASSYAQDGVNPTPTITGASGGTFSATPAGLTLNSSTGEITLSSSTVASYTITYTVSGVSSNVSMDITAASYSNVNSFDFDGVDESFASAIAGSFFSKSNSWSLSCWVQCDVRTSTKGICGNTSNASGIRLRSANSGAPVFGIEFQFHMVGTGTWNGYQLGVISGDYAWSNSTWYHIVVTYDGSSTGAGLKMYVNNNLTTSGSPDFTTSDCVSSYDFAIGAIRHSPFSGGHDGRIDELAIWDSELSASNVTAIYNSGTPDNLTSLAPSYWYRMGEEATWDGTNWTMDDQGSVGTDAVSANMEEADKTTDTP